MPPLSRCRGAKLWREEGRWGEMRPEDHSGSLTGLRWGDAREGLEAARGCPNPLKRLGLSATRRSGPDFARQPMDLEDC